MPRRKKNGMQTNMECLPAPFARRLFAFIIDIALFYFLFFSLFSSIALKNVDYSSITPEQIMADSALLSKLFVIMVASLSILFLYFFMFESEGVTFGESLTGLSVVNEPGGKITPLQAVIRNITKSFLFPLLVIDALPLLLGSKQRFTETLSKTKVIYCEGSKFYFGGMP